MPDCSRTMLALIIFWLIGDQKLQTMPSVDSSWSYAESWGSHVNVFPELPFPLSCNLRMAASWKKKQTNIFCHLLPNIHLTLSPIKR